MDDGLRTKEDKRPRGSWFMVCSLNHRGSTLVELAIAIAILAILVYSLAPQDNLGGLYVEAAADRLEQDLRYIRELAVTRNVNCGIQIQPNGDTILYEGTTASPARNPLTQQAYSYNLSDDFNNVQFQNIITTLTIEFDTVGRPVTGGGSTLQIGETGGGTISLMVTPSTGLVRRL